MMNHQYSWRVKLKDKETAHSSPGTDAVRASDLVMTITRMTEAGLVAPADKKDAEKKDMTRDSKCWTWEGNWDRRG